MSARKEVGSRLKAFKEARKLLRTKYKERGARKRFETFISAATLSRLGGSEEEHPSDAFIPAIQARLIKLVELEDSKSLYSLMAARMGQEDGEKATLLANYVGEYRYFQYASKGGINDVVYVSGRIEIFVNRRGDPAFNHWSHDYYETRPEHRGLVFHYESRIYFAATKQGVMRLGIARTFAEKRDESYLPGLIVSVRNDPHRDPYAARFIMVHSENSNLINELLPGALGAEQAFKDKTAAQDAWYMLLH